MGNHKKTITPNNEDAQHPDNRGLYGTRTVPTRPDDVNESHRYDRQRDPYKRPPLDEDPLIRM